MVIHGLFVVMWIELAIQRNKKHTTQHGTGSEVSVSVTHGQVAGPTAKMANWLFDSCGMGSLTVQRKTRVGETVGDGEQERAKGSDRRIIKRHKRRRDFVG